MPDLYLHGTPTYYDICLLQHSMKLIPLIGSMGIQTAISELLELALRSFSSQALPNGQQPPFGLSFSLSFPFFFSLAEILLVKEAARKQKQLPNCALALALLFEEQYPGFTDDRLGFSCVKSNREHVALQQEVIRINGILVCVRFVGALFLFLLLLLLHYLP